MRDILPPLVERARRREVTKALAVSKRQAQTLLRAAEAEKAIIEVKVGDTVFRLIPASLAQSEKPIAKGRDIDL